MLLSASFQFCTGYFHFCLKLKSLIKTLPVLQSQHCTSCLKFWTRFYQRWIHTLQGIISSPPLNTEYPIKYYRSGIDQWQRTAAPPPVSSRAAPPQRGML